MVETLFIRLNSHIEQKVHWLIWDESQQEIIASGELTSAEELPLLTEKAQSRRVVVFVSSADIAIKQLSAPGNASKAHKLAAPYMLEDDFAQDVDSLFFAFSNEKSNSEYNCFLTAVDKAQMTNWCHWLKQADINPEIMIPDVLAMPVHEHGISAIALEQQILIRQGSWQGAVIESGIWPLVSQQWRTVSTHEKSQVNEVNTEQAAVIHHYSALPEIEQLNVEAMPEELPLALLAQHVKHQSFNLLQGEFEIKRQHSLATKNWLWAAGFCIAALLLNIAYKGATLLQLTNNQQQIEQEIITTYKEAFPKTKRVRVSTIKSQLKQKLSGIGDGGNSDGFLTMLAKLQPALSSVPQLKPENLKFDGKRNEIRMQAVASDFQYFEQFKNTLEKNDFSVTQGAQSNQGDQVSGSYSISWKKGQKR